MLGQQERAPGGQCRQRDLDEMIGRPAGDQQQRPRHHRARRNAAEDGEQQRAADAGDAGIARRRDGEQDRKADRGDAVVEQALRFDEQVQALVDMDPLEHRYHRDGIGRRDEDAEKGGAEPRPTQHIMHAGGDDCRREQHAGRDQQEQQRQLAPERPPGDLDRRFEDQRRQKGGEDQLLGERRVEPDGEHSQRHSGDDQADAIGKVQPPRHHRHERGDEQQQPQHRRIECVHPALHPRLRPSPEHDRTPNVLRRRPERWPQPDVPAKRTRCMSIAAHRHKRQAGSSLLHPGLRPSPEHDLTHRAPAKAGALAAARCPGEEIASHEDRGPPSQKASWFIVLHPALRPSPEHDLTPTVLRRRPERWPQPDVPPKRSRRLSIAARRHKRQAGPLPPYTR